MNIKEQIAALPDGETLQRAPIYYDDKTFVDCDDLKALTDSHTRLLEAAKKAHYSLRNITGRAESVGIELGLQAAIEEAEKL